MARDRIFHYFGRLFVAWIAVTGLLASEHHGIVKSGGLPIPGATVTATQGDKKHVTTTDEQGAYSFPDLPDGVWTIQIDMLGFATFTHDVGVAPQAPSPEWDLTLLSAGQIKAALAPRAPAPVTAAAAPTAAATAPAAAPSIAVAPKPAATAANVQTPGRSNNSQGAGRGAQPANGRPSLRQALDFQRADVNETGDGQAVDAGMANNDLSGDMNQSANDALVFNGSVSSGLGMQQNNDWFPGGRGGMDMGMMGMGGAMGMGGPDMAGAGGAPGAGQDMGGGRGGRGGGPGGPGGGFGGPGGRGGGFGAMGMPGGGRGGRGGGRGGPGGRGNMNSFGNRRGNQRMRYNAALSYQFANSALNAQPYSLTGQATPKPATATNRVTATFGGPLKIPHLLSGQKTTFTINYSLGRNRTGTTTTTTMPTAAERAGDFTQALNLQGQPVTIIDPLNGQPFAGDTVPQNRWSSQALGLLAYYPLPNFASSSRYNYQAPLNSSTNQDNVNARISETINAKNQLSGSLGYQRANGSNQNLFGFTTTNTQSAVNSGVNWMYHFTTRLINRLGYNFSRNAQNSIPFFANRQNLSGELGIAGNDQDPNFWGPPSLSFSNGFAGLSDGSTTNNHNQTSAVSDSIIWVRGTHNITVGGDFRRQQFNNLSEQNARGTLTFTGALSGFDFADFLLGYPGTSQIAFGNADKYFRASWTDAYVTDDWRLSNRVTLSFGLRWDYQFPATELYGRLANLNIGPNFTTASVVCATSVANCTPAGLAGYPSSLVRSDPSELQPRIGFAWRPFAKKQTVVRGGYGIYFNTSVYQSLVTQMSQQSPLSYSVIDSSSAISLLTLANGFPIQTLTPITTFAVDPNFRIGSVQAWQIAIQQSLPASLVATLTYDGSKGTHQAQEFIPNSVPNGAPNSPYPTNYYYMSSNGNSISNVGRAQLQRRFRSGLSGNLLYAYQKALDDVGALGGRGQSVANVAQNWLDLPAERGRTAGIRTHTLSMQMQYSTGMGTRGGSLVNGWKGVLLKGWTLTTTVTAASGAPATPSVAAKTLGGTGIVGALRGFYTGLPVYNQDGTLNSLAFTVPAAGNYGNAGRNIITGPALFSLNGSASRDFRLGERRGFTLSLQATNALNHPSITGWNTTVGSIQYGLPQSASAMRTVSATLRFRF